MLKKNFVTTLLCFSVCSSFSQISSTEKISLQSSVKSEPLMFTWPAVGEVVQTFDPSNKGIDVEGRIGDPITAVADGRVIYAGDGLRGYDKLIIVKHDNDFLSAYSRNSALLVKEDTIVRQGQPIAEMGQVNGVGRLHFEIRHKGKSINPLNYLPKIERKLSASSRLTINKPLWQQFSISDRSTILAKFSNIELASSETVGLIQSVQSVNKSTAGTNTGAILGGALGQAAYIDNTFKGSGNNYSAVNQIGAAVLGSAIGSAADKAPRDHFIFNYVIKTLDGELREVRIASNEAFTKPIGQCVSFPDLLPLQAITCSSDKVQLLKTLSASLSEDSKVQSQKTSVNSDIKIACRVNGVGLMTLERSVCREMDGKEE